MIRILTDNDDLKPVKITAVKRPENFFPGRINGGRQILRFHKLCKLEEIRLLKFFR
jgi:hypothetical protein